MCGILSRRPRGKRTLVILVVSPNPALDRVAVVHFREKATLRPVRFSIWAGGSGTHAGFVAHLLGEQVAVQAFVGGHTGELFRAQLEQQGLEPDLVTVDGETRQTFSQLGASRGNICDVVEQGPYITPEQSQALEDKVCAHPRRRPVDHLWHAAAGPPFIRQNLSDSFEVIQLVKNALDPAGIMSPGKLALKRNN